MPRIHVCSLARLEETAGHSGARSLVTLINPEYDVTRPACIAPERHLRLSLADITVPVEGHVAPDAGHVEQLIDFVRAWDRRDALIIHCFAGVSRSTAAAFIAACTLKPEISETTLANLIRELSPTATPNARLVTLADGLMKRRGRMAAAIQAIGRGQDCYEGVPFQIDIG